MCSSNLLLSKTLCCARLAATVWELACTYDILSLFSCIFYAYSVKACSATEALLAWRKTCIKGGVAPWESIQHMDLAQRVSLFYYLYLFGMNYPQWVLVVQPSVIQLKPDALDLLVTKYNRKNWKFCRYSVTGYRLRCTEIFLLVECTFMWYVSAVLTRCWLSIYSPLASWFLIPVLSSSPESKIKHFSYKWKNIKCEKIGFRAAGKWMPQ